MNNMTINELNFIFVVKHKNMNRGSYRIWVKYLSDNLSDMKFENQIIELYDDVTCHNKVVIFDKGINAIEIEKHLKKSTNVKITAAITPPTNLKLPVDFIIVGSREEELTLSQYSNILFYPLIERPFHYRAIKKHIDSEILRICYHGNQYHLSAFKSSGLKDALEDLAMELELLNRKLVLTVITNKQKPLWLIGKPRIDIEYIKYE